VNTSPNAVTPIIPANTAVPSAWRSSAPAPTAHTSGTTRKMKAPAGNRSPQFGELEVEACLPHCRFLCLNRGFGDALGLG
jgi:hypothetical protein